MKEEMKFSIIFPTYGVEDYLRDSITDILHQYYGKWELIIVDDASLDKSGAIADEFASKDSRITVIHKSKNEGVSEARNTGLEKASGTYTLFLDPDDRFDANLLSALVEEAGLFEKEKGKLAEVIAYGLSEDYYREGKVIYSTIHHLPDGRYVGGDAIYPVLIEMERETLYGYPWNKAFLTDFLKGHGLSFERIVHVEDILFNIAVFDQVEYFSNLSRVPAHYRNQERNEGRRLTGKKLPDYFELQKVRIRRLLSQYTRRKEALDKVARKEALAVFAAEYARSFLSMIEREVAAGTPAKEIDRICRREEETVLYKKLIRFLDTDSRMLKVMFAPIMNGKFATAIMEAKTIHAVKTVAPGLYDRLKQKR